MFAVLVLAVAVISLIQGCVELIRLSLRQRLREKKSPTDHVI